MSVLARIRLAIIVLVIGVAIYIEWPALGQATGDMKYATVTTAELTDEVCGDPDQIDWLGLRSTIESAAGKCYEIFPPDNPHNITKSAAYLQSNRAALQRVADQENARRRDAVFPAIARDLGKPMRSLLLVITIAVAAFVLAPLAVKTQR